MPAAGQPGLAGGYVYAYGLQRYTVDGDPPLVALAPAATRRGPALRRRLPQ
jgi:hypothetical protein